MVDYIRNELKQPGATDWFRTWWTGERGRYCLAHAGYGGSNNNMGFEVDWRDVKDLVLPSSTIGTFTGALMQFIADLSKEHFDILKPTDGRFPSKAILTKHIYDRMQAVHPKTLLYTLPMSTIGERSLEKFEDSDLVDYADRSGVDGAAVHLKIKAYHADVARGDREKSKLKQCELIELLMPRQCT